VTPEKFEYFSKKSSGNYIAKYPFKSIPLVPEVTVNVYVVFPKTLSSPLIYIIIGSELKAPAYAAFV